MRTRRSLMLALVVVLALLPMTLAPVIAAAGQAVLAQADDPGDGAGDPVEDTDASQQGEEAQDEGEGQRDPESQTGPGEGESAAVEEGPVWTYQMARIGLVLMVLLLAAVGFTYWRFVSRRQRLGT